MIYFYLALTILIGYLLGCINFARIFTRKVSNEDITQIGSKNPGAMNMLRTQGFGLALLTLAFEAIKVGAPALVNFFIYQKFNPGYENLAYFLSAFSGIIGHCFPIYYRFKGGKGVSCTFGMFLFHPEFWWVSLIVFAFCFLLFFFIQYGFIITNLFILVMNIYSTVMLVLHHALMWIPIVVILWINFAFIIFLHRGNIKRLIAGTENKVDFKEKVFKHFKKKKSEEQIEVNTDETTDDSQKDE